MATIHMSELARMTGYCDSSLRTILGRSDFANIKIDRGILEGVTKEHIALLRFMKKNRANKKGFYGEMN